MIVVHTRSLVSISPEKSVCSCKSLHVVERACIPTTISPVIDIGVGMGLVCESPPSHARSLAHALITGSANQTSLERLLRCIETELALITHRV